MTTPANPQNVETPKVEEPKVEVAPVIDVTAQVTACLAPVVEGFKAMQGALTQLVEKLSTPAPVLAPAMNAAQLHEQAQSAQYESLKSLGKIGPSAEAKSLFMRATRTPEDLSATVAEYAKLPPLVNQKIEGAPNSSKAVTAQGVFTATEREMARKCGYTPEQLWPERVATA